MIDLHTLPFASLLSGVAVMGGMVHKIIGPSIEKFTRLAFSLIISAMEQKIITEVKPVSGSMTAPIGGVATSATSSAPVVTGGFLGTLENDVTLAETASSTLVAGAKTVTGSIPASGSETEKILSGIEAFVNFATPLIAAVDPELSVLISAVATGITGIASAVESYQAKKSS